VDSTLEKSPSQRSQVRSKMAGDLVRPMQAETSGQSGPRMETNTCAYCSSALVQRVGWKCCHTREGLAMRLWGGVEEARSFLEEEERGSLPREARLVRRLLGVGVPPYELRGRPTEAVGVMEVEAFRAWREE